MTGVADAWAPQSRNGRLRGLLPVVALHLLALLALSHLRAPTPEVASAPVVTYLRLLPSTPPRASLPPSPPRERRRRREAAASDRAATRPPPAAVSPRVDAPPAPALSAHAPAARVLAASPAASAASAPPLLRLDAATLQRAVREAADGPSVSEQAARASDEPVRPSRQQALAGAIQRSGYGDCLKGEYAGAGMLLLSVPFFIAAEARGHCGK